jgi:actin related protein 2/3 complex subunit 1A/1B
MAAPEIFPIAQVPITAHAFNPDRSSKPVHLVLRNRQLIITLVVALSANTSDAQIMTRMGSEWKTTSTLTEVCERRRHLL